MKLRHTAHIIIASAAAAITLMAVAGCSTQKNTAKTRWWHSFNARYNTYYNGSLAYIDGSLEKENGNKDNFTELIPLYTVGNKASREMGKGNFDRAIEKCQKAIKLHSIKRRPAQPIDRRGGTLAAGQRRRPGKNPVTRAFQALLVFPRHFLIRSRLPLFSRTLRSRRRSSPVFSRESRPVPRPAVKIKGSQR